MKKSTKEFREFLTKVIYARDLTGDDSLFEKYYFSCCNVQVRTLEDFHFALNLINLLEAYEFKKSKLVDQQLDEIIKKAKLSKEDKK
ncbi:MAG TPA: hypothetical protein ENI02_02940 [Candidatus Aminicenantes bacterium]|nr:hypothetical protein [Candidatus Aminicenantes bacterium]